MTEYSDHPGYLGLTSHGVLAIHADWPMYPVEHGYAVALVSLASFPRGTVFRKIDDIDRCILFLVGDPEGVEDPFDEMHFHVAVWHEDLLELQRKELIERINSITERELARQRLNQLENHYYEDADGELRPVPLADPGDYDDEFETIAEVLEKGVTLTERGYQKVTKLLANSGTLHEDLEPVVRPFVNQGRYDTAVREACVLLESRLRELTDTRKYGQRLVEEAIYQLTTTEMYISALLKAFRAELRTLFKFTRNKYAHNFVSVERNQCNAILQRISGAVGLIAALETATEEEDEQE